MVDPDGRAIYENSAFELILGYGTDHYVGRDTFELVHQDDRGGVHGEFDRMLEDAEYVASARYRARHRDGSWRVLESEGRNLLRVPFVNGIVITTRDVSEHREMESRLHRVERLAAMGRLAGGIAHDFNNLLTAIRGYAGLIEDDLREPGLQRDRIAIAAREISATVERASALTDELLAFGRREVEPLQTVSVDEVVGSMRGLFEQLLDDDVRLEVELQAPDAMIRVDPVEFEQVVLNLVLNANDAMPEGGRISISTGEERDTAGERYVRVSVADTGEGIDEELADAIFQPFFTTKEDGTGLGLATVRTIVERYGGEIRVDSRVERGTRFDVSFSRTEPVGSSGDGRPDRAERKLRTGDETILVVEDDSSIRNLIEQVLERRGYEVMTASAGPEALMIVEQTPVDLVLSDVVMPGMSGAELAERVVELRPEVSIVLMSGYSDPEKVPETILERYGFIAKPFDPDTLLDVVQRGIDQGEPT